MAHGPTFFTDDDTCKAGAQADYDALIRTATGGRRTYRVNLSVSASTDYPACANPFVIA